jgi:antagonist of KipI
LGNKLIHIEQCGFLTTIQDGGRKGYLQYGVGCGGAMDSYSMKLANILVANDENEPILEITQAQHRFKFLNDAVIAFTGGGLQPTMNEKPLALFQPLFIPAKTIIECRQPVTGFRLYMSLAGGFEAGTFLNSYSTDVTVREGGFYGRALKKGDELHSRKKLNAIQEQLKKVLEKSSFAFNHYFTINHNNSIRVFHGAEWNYLTDEAKQKISSTHFAVLPQSSRMGYRLLGEQLQTIKPCDIISSPVTQGTVQLTSSGELIVLMADAQTIGGYPRILQVAAADLPIMAQKKPGDQIQFEIISLEQAEALLTSQNNQLLSLQQTIQRLYAH